MHINDRKFKEWICNEIYEEKVSEDHYLLILPFKLRSDDYLTLHIYDKMYNKIEISDGGQIMELLLVYNGLLKEDFNKDQNDFMGYIIESYNLTYSNETFSMLSDKDNLMEDIMYFIQAIIQLSLIDIFE